MDQQEKVGLGNIYCREPTVHTPDVACFTEHDYIERITKNDTENQVSVIKIPDGIFKEASKKLTSIINRLPIRKVGQQTFQKIPNVNDAFLYQFNNKTVLKKNHKLSRYAQYCNLVENQHEKIVFHTANRQKSTYNGEFFDNFLNSSRQIHSFYAPDIDYSITSKIGKKIINFDLTKIERSIINQLVEDKNHKVIDDEEEEEEEGEETETETETEEEEDQAHSKPKKKTAKKGVSGIHRPFVYIGSNGSCFPVHIEDSYLSSINIHLYGSPKVWFFIRKKSVIDFEKCVNGIIKDKALYHPDCSSPIRHKIIVINENFLIARKFFYCRVVQEPGMMVVTHPNGYHGGFNCGMNINEAVNALFPDGIDCVLNDEHYSCRRTFRLSHGKLMSRFRPNWGKLNAKRSNLDNEETIMKKKLRYMEKMKTARAGKVEEEKIEFTDEELESYLQYIIEKGCSSLTPNFRISQKYRKHLKENKIEITDDTKQLSLRAFGRFVNRTVSQHLDDIIKRPYFNDPGRSGILEFLKSKRRE